MNPGMPGTGIGGLFYVLSALWMPICEVWRRSRGKTSVRWFLIAKQFAIAVGVVAVMSGVFWALDSALILYHATQHSADQIDAARTLRISAMLMAVGVLVSLLSVVHLARLFLWLRGARTAGR
jgi:hypothetical protein